MAKVLIAKRVVPVLLAAVGVVLIHQGIVYFQRIQPIDMIQAHSAPIEAVHFSPDGSLITTIPNPGLRGANRWSYGGSSQVSGTHRQATVKQWQWQTATLNQTFSDPLGLSDSLVFSSASGALASRTRVSSQQSAIRLWEMASGHLLTELADSDQDLQLVGFDDAQARLVTTAGSTVQLWDATTGEHQQTLTLAQGQPSQLAVSANGHVLAAGNHNFVQVWNLETAGTIRTINISAPEQIRALALSPDGDRLAIDQTKRLMLINRDTGQTIASVSYSGWLPALRRGWNELSWPSGCVAFSLDGNQLALRVGREIWLMRGTNGRVVRKIKLEPDASGKGVPRALAFSPDSHTLAMGDYGGNLHFWQLP